MQVLLVGTPQQGISKTPRHRRAEEYPDEVVSLLIGAVVRYRYRPLNANETCEQKRRVVNGLVGLSTDNAAEVRTYVTA